MKQVLLSLTVLFALTVYVQAQQPQNAQKPSNTFVTESVIAQDQAQQSPSDAASVVEPMPANSAAPAMSADCCCGRTRVVRRNNCCDPCQGRRGFFFRFGRR